MRSTRTIHMLVFLLLAVMVSLASAEPLRIPLRVNVMPGNQPGNPYRNPYPYTWPNNTLTIWGNVHGGTAPYTFRWEFGDGTPAATGDVVNPKFVSVDHAYTTMGPKTAVLTIIDDNGVSGSDTVEIEVAPRDLKVEINAAIEKGLRYLYLQQWEDGRWSDYGCDAATTSLAVLAFENQGYRPTGNFDKDIYAEYVKAGLDFVTSMLGTQPIDPQPYGDPEEIAPGNEDNNGYGVYPMSCYPPYEIGMVMMALVASYAPDMPAVSLDPAINGRTYRDLVVDMVDYCAWAQNEYDIYRGGWRYSANYWDSDNSVSQWPPIGLEAAESNWGISAPAFVKSELQLWINASQVSDPGGFWDGAFYYVPPSWIEREAMPATGAGLCEMAYCDVPQSDQRFQRALGFLERNWGSGYNKIFYYTMYAIAKGCRIAVNDLGHTEEVKFIGGVEWYPDYAQALVTSQHVDGSWPQYGWGNVLDDSWAILVLEPTVSECRPIARIDAIPSTPPGKSFKLDGTGSYVYGGCSGQRIVSWLWDFDESDSIDWNEPDAVGDTVQNPGYQLQPGILADTFTITLRVADNSDPIMYDFAKHKVIVDRGNHPPVACAGGPYAARVCDTIAFDGTCSHDADSGDYIASYSWDLNGDGIFGDCTDSICEYSSCVEQSGYVGLIVTDSYGVSSRDSSYTKWWFSRRDVGFGDVAENDVFLSERCPNPGEIVTVYAIVRCSMVSDPVSNILVRFYLGDPDVQENQINGDQIIPQMVAGEIETLSVSLTIPPDLPCSVYVRIDPEESLQESNEQNNQAIKIIAPCPEIFPTPEWISLYCDTLRLNGTIVAQGSVIKAYDPDGVLCGIDTVEEHGKFGFMAVYRDDIWPPDIDEGAEPGDKISFTIDDQVVYPDMDIIWTENGARFQICNFITQTCIVLHEGWNLISWNVDTPEDSIQILAAEVMPNVDVILSFENGALTYDPLLPQLSTLHLADHLHGFWFRMLADDTLCLNGVPVPAATPINLEENWNLASYLPIVPYPVPQALASIWSYVVIVLGYDMGALTYDPANPGLSTLTAMEPTFGYWIKTTQACDLVYPGPLATFVNNPVDQTAVATKPLPGVAISNTWVDLYGTEVTVDGKRMAVGTLIQAFNPDGLLVGEYLVKTEGMFGFMPIYGADNYSGSASGSSVGQTIRLTLDGYPVEETVTWTGNGDRIKINQFHYQATSAGDAAVPLSFSLKQNYPNPFNPSTIIDYVVAKGDIVDISVYNILGERVKTLVHGYQAQGNYSAWWDGSTDYGEPVASGVYLYKLSCGNFTAVRKMTLLK